MSDESLEDRSGVERWVRELTDHLRAVHAAADAVVDRDIDLCRAEAQEALASYIHDHPAAEHGDDLGRMQIELRVRRPAAHSDGRLLLHREVLLRQLGDVPMVAQPPLPELCGARVALAVDELRAGLGLAPLAS